MKKRFLIAMIASVALVITSLILLTVVRVPSRTIMLVISGPEGQRFTGTYTADGVTNSVSAMAPAKVSFQARNVSYEFHREGGTGEFRVALYVNGSPRTSTTSDKRPGVRGELKYAASHERYWAEGFGN